jgi:hypothetical protein
MILCVTSFGHCLGSPGRFPEWFSGLDLLLSGVCLKERTENSDPICSFPVQYLKWGAVLWSRLLWELLSCSRPVGSQNLVQNGVSTHHHACFVRQILMDLLDWECNLCFARLGMDFSFFKLHVIRRTCPSSHHHSDYYRFTDARGFLWDTCLRSCSLLVRFVLILLGNRRVVSPSPVTHF